jgi:hypothetical protein
MCKGMHNLVGQNVQQVVLTRHRDTSIRKSNARAMCKQSNGISICGLDASLPAQSDGSPLNIPSNLGPDVLNKWYLATECDEFPFASSCEGGDLGSGSSYCLSAWENRWGSWQMRPWNALQAGQRCTVIIDKSWDCNAASAIGGGAPVGNASPARLAKRTELLSNTFSGGINYFLSSYLSFTDSLGDLYLNADGPGENGLGMTLGNLDAGK